MPIRALAQVDRATLTGTVADNVGAVVPGATVTVTNTATNVSAQQQTTESGSFLFVNLIPGVYDVSVELSGFKKTVQTLALEVAQRARVNVVLDVGAFTESVNVTESSRRLNANDATLGTVIDQTQVAKLPLAIRNWDDLLALVPGVQGDRYTEEGGGTVVRPHRRRQRARHPLAAEQLPARRRRQQQHLRQRAGADDAGLAALDRRHPGVQGRDQPLLGGVRPLAGRRHQRHHQVGHQRLHGTVYDYFRNDRSTRTTSSPKRAGAARSRHNDQNQFGANLGGPIVKDKAFFFADYEGTRITRGVTRITRVPTARRAGRHLHAAPSATRSPASPSRATRIPADRIDPVAAGDPRPCCRCRTSRAPTTSSATPTSPTTRTASWPASTCGPTAATPSSARYIYSNRDRFIPGAFGGVIDGTGTSAFGDQTIKSHGLVGGWTRDPRPVGGERVPLLLVARPTPTPCSRPFGQLPPRRRDRFQACRTDPLVARRRHRHHHRRLLRRAGPRPHRLARLPAQVPAHEPVRVPEHALLAARRPRSSSSAST